MISLTKENDFFAKKTNKKDDGQMIESKVLCLYLFMTHLYTYNHIFCSEIRRFYT